MRISDWSSDVCSSDLLQSIDTENIQPLIFLVRSDGASGRRALANDFDGVAFFKNKCRHGHARQPGKTSAAILRPRVRHLQLSPVLLFVWHGNPARSEEHTSELQSLMRISYAVFCLKKKNKM